MYNAWFGIRKCLVSDVEISRDIEHILFCVDFRFKATNAVTNFTY